MANLTDDMDNLADATDGVATSTTSLIGIYALATGAMQALWRALPTDDVLRLNDAMYDLSKSTGVNIKVTNEYKAVVREVSEATNRYSQVELANMLAAQVESSVAVAESTIQLKEYLQVLSVAFPKGADRANQELIKLAETIPGFSENLMAGTLDMQMMHDVMQSGGKEAFSAYAKYIETVNTEDMVDPRILESNIERIKVSLANMFQEVGEDIAGTADTVSLVGRGLAEFKPIAKPLFNVVAMVAFVKLLDVGADKFNKFFVRGQHMTQEMAKQKILQLEHNQLTDAGLNSQQASVALVNQRKKAYGDILSQQRISLSLANEGINISHTALIQDELQKNNLTDIVKLQNIENNLIDAGISKQDASLTISQLKKSNVLETIRAEEIAAQLQKEGLSVAESKIAAGKLVLMQQTQDIGFKKKAYGLTVAQIKAEQQINNKWALRLRNMKAGLKGLGEWAKKNPGLMGMALGAGLKSLGDALGKETAVGQVAGGAGSIAMGAGGGAMMAPMMGMKAGTGAAAGLMVSSVMLAVSEISKTVEANRALEASATPAAAALRNFENSVNMVNTSLSLLESEGLRAAAAAAPPANIGLEGRDSTARTPVQGRMEDVQKSINRMQKEYNGLLKDANRDSAGGLKLRMNIATNIARQYSTYLKLFEQRQKEFDLLKKFNDLSRERGQIFGDNSTLLLAAKQKEFDLQKQEVKEGQKDLDLLIKMRAESKIYTQEELDSLSKKEDMMIGYGLIVKSLESSSLGAEKAFADYAERNRKKLGDIGVTSLEGLKKHYSGLKKDVDQHNNGLRKMAELNISLEDKRVELLKKENDILTTQLELIDLQKKSRVEMNDLTQNMTDKMTAFATERAVVSFIKEGSEKEVANLVDNFQAGIDAVNKKLALSQKSLERIRDLEKANVQNANDRVEAQNKIVMAKDALLKKAAVSQQQAQGELDLIKSQIAAREKEKAAVSDEGKGPGDILRNSQKRKELQDEINTLMEKQKDAAKKLTAEEIKMAAAEKVRNDAKEIFDKKVEQSSKADQRYQAAREAVGKRINDAYATSDQVIKDIVELSNQLADITLKEYENVERIYEARKKNLDLENETLEQKKELFTLITGEYGNETGFIRDRIKNLKEEKNILTDKLKNFDAVKGRTKEIEELNKNLTTAANAREETQKKFNDAAAKAAKAAKDAAASGDDAAKRKSEELEKQKKKLSDQLEINKKNVDQIQANLQHLKGMTDAEFKRYKLKQIMNEISKNGLEIVTQQLSLIDKEYEIGIKLLELEKQRTEIREGYNSLLGGQLSMESKISAEKIKTLEKEISLAEKRLKQTKEMSPEKIVAQHLGGLEQARDEAEDPKTKKLIQDQIDNFKKLGKEKQVSEARANVEKKIALDIDAKRLDITKEIVEEIKRTTAENERNLGIQKQLFDTADKTMRSLFDAATPEAFREREVLAKRTLEIEKQTVKALEEAAVKAARQEAGVGKKDIEDMTQAEKDRFEAAKKALLGQRDIEDARLKTHEAQIALYDLEIEKVTSMFDLDKKRLELQMKFMDGQKEIVDSAGGQYSVEQLMGQQRIANIERQMILARKELDLMKDKTAQEIKDEKIRMLKLKISSTTNEQTKKSLQEQLNVTEKMNPQELMSLKRSEKMVEIQGLVSEKIKERAALLQGGYDEENRQMSLQNRLISARSAQLKALHAPIGEQIKFAKMEVEQAKKKIALEDSNIKAKQLIREMAQKDLADLKKMTDEELQAEQKKFKERSTDKGLSESERERAKIQLESLKDRGTREAHLTKALRDRSKEEQEAIIKKAEAEKDLADKVNFVRRTWMEQMTELSIGLGTGTHIMSTQLSQVAARGPAYQKFQRVGEEGLGKGPGTYAKVMRDVFGGAEARTPMEKDLESINEKLGVQTEKFDKLIEATKENAPPAW